MTNEEIMSKILENALKLPIEDREKLLIELMTHDIKIRKEKSATAPDDEMTPEQIRGAANWIAHEPEGGEENRTRMRIKPRTPDEEAAHNACLDASFAAIRARNDALLGSQEND